MRQDPLFLSWTIRSGSPDKLRQIMDELRRQINPDYVLTEQVSFLRDGREVTHQEHYRIGDFFETIRLLPPSSTNGPLFHVVIQRLPNAGRRWKDVMVRI